MSDRRDLVPVGIRIAVRNAIGGWGPYTVREIEDLFNAHQFFETDDGVPDAGGQRRTAVEQFHARIDWASRDQARRYLDLVADVLDQYPEATEEPKSPGRILRRALLQANFIGPDGRLRLPDDRLAGPAEPDIGGTWAPEGLRIFLSHVHEVRAEVTDIANALESHACTCFVAHVQIEPARPWQEIIETALQTCHALVAYLTPDFPRSKWTDQEVGWALSRGVPIVPVNAGLQPYGFLGSVQSLPAHPKSPWNTATNVFRAIAVAALRGQTNHDIVPLVARTVIRSFCRSPSYESTRQRFPLLELIPVALWTEDMVSSLIEATKTNSQIREGMLSGKPPQSVPDAIRHLVARLGLTGKAR